MGRLIRISIYALIILILYFWITTIIKSYQVDDMTAPNNEITEEKPLTQDSMTMTSNVDSVDLLTNEDIIENKLDYKALDEKVKKLENKENDTKQKTNESITKSESQKKMNTQKSLTTNKESNTTSSAVIKGDGGPYLVMAGSYLLRENAVKQVNKLKALGYQQAQIVVFQASEYHSVIAARFSVETKARAASVELKRKGIDSFVKVK